MLTCDNCQTPFDAHKEGLTAASRGLTAAAVCGACCEGARVVKLVLRRSDLGALSYEQYAAIEMAKGAR